MYYDEYGQYHDDTPRTSPARRYYANVEGEPFRNFDPVPSVTVQSKPKKKKHAGGIVALALSCALLGGAVGGGAVWAIGSRNGQFAGSPVVRETTTTIQVNERTGDATPVRAIDGKTVLTDAEVYANQVSSVVSINVTGNSYNVFGQPVQTASSGSGFILTADGYIVTNYHVIDGGESVKVTLYNDETYDATIIGGDEDYDIAVLKIEGTFQPVTLGDSTQLRVGDRVTTIGNPLGELTFSMSEGIASSVNRAINVDGVPFNMIQVTCAINPGNSGGPLFNQYGEVVGIVSAKYSSYSTSTVEGLGFAIPMNDVLSMIEDIMTNNYVPNKPYMGIFAGSYGDVAAQYRYGIESGVFVYSTDEGGAAERAGLKSGDVITKVDDNEIKTMQDLTIVKKKYSAGDTSVLTVWREGEYITLTMVWDEVPAEDTTTTQAQQPEQQYPYNGRQYGGNYSSPFGNWFDYFFGGGW